MLFFVLSGFVLTLSLKNKKIPYKKYLVSRFFRLYPVLFVAIIISFVTRLIIGHNSTSLFSQWYQSDFLMPIPLSISNLLGHLALTGISKEHIFLNNPIWSLVYEARMSIIFPFLLLFVTMRNKPTVIFLSLALSLCSAALLLITTGIAPKGYMESSFIATLATTAYYVIFFIAGILLALNHERVSKIVAALPAIIKFLLLVAAISCFIFDRRSFGITSIIMDYFHMAGAVLLIVLAAYWDWLSRLLSVRPLIWLGRISYSLYLIHWVVLYAVFELLGDTLPYWQLPIIITVISLICAELMSRFVEYPCIELGKSLNRPS